MTDPVFHLSGIVHSQDSLEDFDGPLSLILQLLSKNKIEIRDIRITLILDQYLDYLKQMDQMDLEVASEFVAMASHLAYIKSKMLVAPEGEEISELEELIQGLERLRRKDEYAKIKAITDSLSSMYKHGAGYIPKAAEPLPVQKGYPYIHSIEKLTQSLIQMMDREQSQAQISAMLAAHYPKRVTFPVSVKADEIQTKLRQYGMVSLSGLFFDCKSKSEMIAVFISVLEMCKSGSVLLSGEGDNLVLCRSEKVAEVDYSQYEGGIADA